MHADGAVHAVVDDHKDDIQLALNGSGELLPVHLKTPVPIPRHHDTLRMGRLGRDRRRDSVSHRAVVRSELGPETAMAIEAMQPHRVVACAVGQNRVLRQALAQLRHHLPQIELTGHRPRLLPRQIVAVRLAGVCEPGRVRNGCHLRQRGCKCRHRRLYGERRLEHASELLAARVNVNERLRRLRRAEQRVAAGRHLTEALAGDEENIGVAHPRRQLGIDRDPDVTGIELVTVVEEILGAKRAGDRNGIGLGEAAHVCARRFVPPAAADDDQRLLRSSEHFAELGNLRRRGMDSDRLDACGVVDLRHRCEHVLGQGQHHRTGPPLSRDPERARDVFRNALRAIDLRHPFGNASIHAPIVDFLKRFAISEIAADLPDKNNERRRVLLRGVDADGRIRRAGPAGHERDARTAGQLAVRFRHVGGAALMATDDQPQRFARFIESVEDGEIALARNAEGEVDALPEEIGDQNLATGARRAHWLGF